MVFVHSGLMVLGLVARHLGQLRSTYFCFSFCLLVLPWSFYCTLQHICVWTRVCCSVHPANIKETFSCKLCREWILHTPHNNTLVFNLDLWSQNPSRIHNITTLQWAVPWPNVTMSWKQNWNLSKILVKVKITLQSIKILVYRWCDEWDCNRTKNIRPLMAQILHFNNLCL